MKSISVFGLGYVGAVTAACFAHLGHRVIGVDVNATKVDLLRAGKAPVLEPGLDELVAEGCKTQRLQATTDAAEAVRESDISFVCVGTPSLRNGRLDLGAVERISEAIGRALQTKNGFHHIVIRSTVLPGTAKSLVIPTIEAASGKRCGLDFGVCSNPEFTREASAVADFLNPSMTVIGADNAADSQPIRELYAQFTSNILETTLSTAEMVKYVCNAFHALKATFANEIGSLCNQLDVDPRAVTDIFISDTKLNISSAYLMPGFAFGGSCLPKDLRALNYCAKQADLELPLLRSIIPSNQAHLERAVEAVLMTRRKRVAVLGLSFKAGTDDLRESPSVELIKRLLGEGRQVRIWDPDVSLGCLVGSNRQFIEEELPHIATLLSTNLEDVVKQADVVVIGTKAIADHTVAALLRADQIVIDLRCALAPFPLSLAAQQDLDHDPEGLPLGSLAFEAA